MTPGAICERVVEPFVARADADFDVVAAVQLEAERHEVEVDRLLAVLQVGVDDRIEAEAEAADEAVARRRARAPDELGVVEAVLAPRREARPPGRSSSPTSWYSAVASQMSFRYSTRAAVRSALSPIAVRRSELRRPSSRRRRGSCCRGTSRSPAGSRRRRCAAIGVPSAVVGGAAGVERAEVRLAQHPPPPPRRRGSSRPARLSSSAVRTYSAPTSFLPAWPFSLPPPMIALRLAVDEADAA